MRFSWLKISSRRVKTVEPSCGTNAIGACLRILAKSGYGSAQNAGTSISKCGALDIGLLHPEFLPGWRYPRAKSVLIASEPTLQLEFISCSQTRTQGQLQGLQ